MPQRYRCRDPEAVAAIELRVRTFVAVPMLKDDEVIGAFLLNRKEVRPFTNKQIELVQNFAAQAVIAIENARLLNELKQSLERQTATQRCCKLSQVPRETLNQYLLPCWKRRFTSAVPNSAVSISTKAAGFALSQGSTWNF
jgi:transcriptional regulator with GAF, ATPase, and Fis domain